METQTERAEKMKEARKTAGILFTGCMFIGMAIGWYSGAFTIGMFGGMGIGFILMAVVIATQANKR